MTKLKTLIIAFVLLSISFANAQDEPKKFALQIGTGIGFIGLQRINGGAYSGPNITTQGGVPIYIFIPSSFFLTINASERFKWFEPFLEIQNGNFSSDKTYQDRNLKVNMHFLNFNFGAKIHPIKPMFGIDPYVKGTMYIPIYDYTMTTNTNINNPNSVILEDSNNSSAGLFGLAVGGDYMFTKNLGVYLQVGYGFEVVQLGGVIKL